MLWYNMCVYSLCPGSCHRVKSSWVMGMRVSFVIIKAPFNRTWIYANEVTLGGGGLVNRGTNHVIRVIRVIGGLVLSLPLGKLEIDLITSVQWFSQFACIRSLNNGVWGASAWWAHWSAGRFSMPTEGMEVLNPLLYTLLYASLPFGCFWVLPFI